MDSARHGSGMILPMNPTNSQFRLSFIKGSIQLDVVECRGKSQATGEAVLLPQLAD